MLRRATLPLLQIAGLAALYLWGALNWSYSTGERAGWVQKLSNKGWVCKTWEGELALVSLPGTTPEKFLFTIRDERVADQVSKAMGRRASVHYEEKVGLPGSCFGDTRYYVTGVTLGDEAATPPGSVAPAASAAGVPVAAGTASAAAAAAATAPR